MKRALIFVGLAVLVTIVILAVVLRRSPSTTNTNKTTNTSTTTTTNAPIAVRDESPEGKDRSEAQTTARIVAERLGSYSSDTLPTIVSELTGYLTTNGQRDAETFVALERQRLAQAAGSVSLTTTALTTNVKQFRFNATATIELQTKRVEQVGQSTPITKQQTISIGLIKRNGRWQVDDATWQ